MITKDLIVDLVEEKLKGTDKYIVDVSVTHDNRISVYLDSDHKLTINDCTEVSRFIESQLNRDTEDFELLVSSYGLDKGFKLKRQYLKNIGKEIEVILKSGEKKQGKLINVNDNGIEIIMIKNNKKKAKNTEKETLNLLFNNIKETKAVITIKK